MSSTRHTLYTTIRQENARLRSHLLEHMKLYFMYYSKSGSMLTEGSDPSSPRSESLSSGTTIDLMEAWTSTSLRSQKRLP